LGLVFDLLALTQPILPPPLLCQSGGVVGELDPLVDVPDPRRDVSLGALEAKLRVSKRDTLRIDEASPFSRTPEELDPFGRRFVVERHAPDELASLLLRRHGAGKTPHRFHLQPFSHSFVGSLRRGLVNT